jgi:hypothetical protein
MAVVPQAGQVKRAAHVGSEHLIVGAAGGRNLRATPVHPDGRHAVLDLTTGMRRGGTVGIVPVCVYAFGLLDLQGRIFPRQGQLLRSSGSFCAERARLGLERYRVQAKARAIPILVAVSWSRSRQSSGSP